MKFLAFIVLCLLLGAMADKEVEEGGVTVKVLGKSGKIRITTSEGKDVTIEMDEMKERDSSDNEVGKSGSTKHSFNNFASQDFIFRDTVDVIYHGVEAQQIEFYAYNLVESATLTVPILIFKEYGNFTIGTTEYIVNPGNVKFNFEVVDWSFCGRDVTCKQGNTDEVGEYIEFVITIKGAGAGKEVTDPEEDWENGLVVYDLGGGERLYMAKEIQKDGVWEQMRPGFPGYEVQGSKQKFSFAIPMFSSNSTYDPCLNVNYGDSDSGSSNVMVTPLLVLLLAVFNYVL